MKKFLLGAFALCAAMSVNAQEICPINAEVLYDFSTDADGKYVVPAGTVLGETDNAVCSVFYDDDFGTSNLSYGLNINGEDIEKNDGVQGTTNGPGASASDGTYPTSGAIFKFVVNKDGYIYLIHKGSYNKNYVVFEDRYRIPYYFSMYDSSNAVFGSYDLSNGYVDPNGATASYYDSQYDEWILTDGYAIQTPQVYDTALAGATSGGVSVMKFRVFADEGLEYLAFATGSKMTLGYFIFSEEDNVTITTSPTSEDETWGPVTLCSPGGSTGISSTVINVDSNSGKIYNIAGQRVNSNTKGLLIQDGKKYLNK